MDKDRVGSKVSPIFDEEEDSLDIADRNWNRIIAGATKIGYREGREDGSESVFQEGFDKGYEEAFETAFVLGKLKSLTNAMPAGTETPQDVKESIDKTRRGACYLCKLESQDKNRDIDTMSFSTIVCEQKIHSTKVIERLYQHFEPVLERLNLDTSDSRRVQNDTRGAPNEESAANENR